MESAKPFAAEQCRVGIFAMPYATMELLVENVRKPAAQNVATIAVENDATKFVLRVLSRANGAACIREAAKCPAEFHAYERSAMSDALKSSTADISVLHSVAKYAPPPRIAVLLTAHWQLTVAIWWMSWIRKQLYADLTATQIQSWFSPAAMHPQFRIWIRIWS